MIDRKAFFDRVRYSFGRLNQGQVDGFNAILAGWEQMGYDDERWLAYSLATSWHETATIMLPVIETRRANEAKNPSVDTAIARLENSWAAGKLPWVKKPYWRKDANGLSWLGRGLPQVTFYDNYIKCEELTGIPFSKNPDLMLQTDGAVPVLLKGMDKGIFTGVGFEDFFNSKKDDPVNARRIINGTDDAKQIAGYHQKFLDAIKEIPVPPPPPPEPEAPPPLVGEVDETIWIRRAEVAAETRVRVDKALAELRAMADEIEGLTS